jgi:hypothetical protein
VSDRETVVTKSFVVTVNSVFDPAFISDLPNTNNRDSSLVNIPVFIGADNRPDCLLSLSATSDNPALLPQSAISIGGDYPDCTVSLYPPPLDKITGIITITLTVNDSSQTVQDTFTVEIFPIWYQEAFIKASNAESDDNFGSALSLAGDTLIVGALAEDSNQTTITNGTTSGLDNDATNSGAVYIYRRSVSEWVQESYLKAVNSEVNDQFGSSVIISGSTLAVGVRLEDSNQTTITNGTTASSNNSATSSGAVYVYERTGTQWTQEAYVKAVNTEPSAEFGSAVSLSDNTLVVGAYQEDNNQSTITNGSTAATTLLYGYPGMGAVYVYRRVGNQWAQQAYIKAANARMFAYFGASISLSGDTLAVGSWGEYANQTTITNGTTASSDSSAVATGAVYIYRRTGVQWGQEAYVKAANAEAYDRFGTSVALSGDILAVGAQRESSNQTVITNDSTASADNSAYASGAVYIYRRNGTQWAQEAYVKAANAASNDGFGLPVALTGNTLAVGATGEDSSQTTLTNSSAASSDDTLTDSGAVYVYRRTGSLWAQEAYLKAFSGRRRENFGQGITLSGDTLAVGSIDDSGQTTITNGSMVSTGSFARNSGAVYVFRNSRRLFDPDVYVSGRTSTSLTFNWGGNLGSGTTVKVAPAASGTATAAADCTGGTVLPDGTTSYTYSGLASSTKYGFRFCAWDGSTASGGTTLWAETQP